MEFIKKHWFKFLLGIIAILIIWFGYFVYTLIFPNDEDDLYGNRLIEMKEHIVEQNVLNDLKSSLESSDQITSVVINQSGRIYSFILTFEESVTIEEAKLFSNSILVVFSKEQREYYDIQLFLINDKQDKFPTIGYKHHTTLDFVWSNNSI